MSRLRVVFCVSGRGMLYRAAVERKDECLIDPVLLVAEVKASLELDAFSSAHQVPVARLDPAVRSAFDEAVTRHCIRVQADLIALTFDRIIPPDLVAAYSGRIINVHPALLPSFPGMNAVRRTLASGALVGGATIHEVTNEVDAGPLIAQAIIPVGPSESVEVYGQRMYRVLEPMFLQVLRWFAEGRVERGAQGRNTVLGAQYGVLPVNPGLERFSPIPPCAA